VRRDPDRLSDAELLRANDAEAFTELYDRHVAQIHAWARARVGEHAADLTAEVFARAWLARRRFRDEGGGSAAPWLLGIAANVLRESLKNVAVESKARRKLGLPPALAPDDDLEAVEERLSLPAAALRAVRDLPASEREILTLRVVEERPYREIAERLGCSSQAARLRVSRALHRLHATVEGGPS
jgi:RNA polymerase sigma-70 factor (ECF subfamily)